MVKYSLSDEGESFYVDEDDYQDKHTGELLERMRREPPTTHLTYVFSPLLCDCTCCEGWPMCEIDGFSSPDAYWEEHLGW